MLIGRHDPDPSDPEEIPEERNIYGAVTIACESHGTIVDQANEHTRAVIKLISEYALAGQSLSASPNSTNKPFKVFTRDSVLPEGLSAGGVQYIVDTALKTGVLAEESYTGAKATRSSKRLVVRINLDV